MKYSMEKIGARIAQERKLNGYKNQEALCEELHISRNTLSKLENGQGSIELEVLIKLCELFNCDIGYLLCEYDCKHHTTADIHEITGLSEKAIENLKRLREKPLFGGNSNFYSKMFEDEMILKLPRQFQIKQNITTTQPFNPMINAGLNYSLIMMISEIFERSYNIQWHP